MKVTFAIILCFMLTGCAGSRSGIVDDQEVEIQESLIEQPCIIEIKAPESEEMPMFPSHDPEDLKNWAIKMREIYFEREALKDREIKILRELIASHNALEPKCSKVD